MLISNFSVGSVSLSSMVLISNVAVLWPAGIFTVYTPLKSEPSWATPLYERVTVTSVAAGWVRFNV